MPPDMRVRRNLFTLAATLSAVLCVAVCAAWVSSYLGEADTLELSRSGPVESRWVSSESGSLLFVQRSANAHPDNNPKQEFVSPSLFGVRYRKAFSLNVHTITVEAPHWLLAALTAALPVAWVAGRIRRRRDPRSVPCPVCGYDLRATTGRCPECGSFITGTARA